MDIVAIIAIILFVVFDTYLLIEPFLELGDRRRLTYSLCSCALRFLVSNADLAADGVSAGSIRASTPAICFASCPNACRNPRAAELPGVIPLVRSPNSEMHNS